MEREPVFRVKITNRYLKFCRVGEWRNRWMDISIWELNDRKTVSVMTSPNYTLAKKCFKTTLTITGIYEFSEVENFWDSHSILKKQLINAKLLPTW